MVACDDTNTCSHRRADGTLSASARRPSPTPGGGPPRRRRRRCGARRGAGSAARARRRAGLRSARSGRAHRQGRPAPGTCPADQCAPWITHGHDVLEPAEHRASLPDRLGGAIALVGGHRHAAPAALLAHRARDDIDAAGAAGHHKSLGLGYGRPTMAETLKIVILEGDETGQELLEQAIRVLAPDVIGLELDLAHYDLSLENRRATNNEVVTESARAMKECGLGIKAATITPEGKDDVGSPNRLLREGVDGKVIIRTGRRIPGVTPIAGRPPPHLRRADGRRGRLRRRAVARGRGGRARRDRLPHREDHPVGVPGGGRGLVPDRREDGRQGLRRPEVDGLPGLRGHAQGGDGRRRRAPPGASTTSRSSSTRRTPASSAAPPTRRS